MGYLGVRRVRLIFANRVCCVIFLMSGLAVASSQTFVTNAGFEIENGATGFAEGWWFVPAGIADYHNPEPNKRTAETRLSV